MPVRKPPKEHRHSTTWTRQVRETLQEVLCKTAVVTTVAWVHTRPHKGADGERVLGRRPGLKVQWGALGAPTLRWQSFPYATPSRTERALDPADVADEIALGIRAAVREERTMKKAMHLGLGGAVGKPAPKSPEAAERVRMSGKQLALAYGVSPARTGPGYGDKPDDIIVTVSINPCSARREDTVWRALRNALVVGGFAVHDEGASERMVIAELPPGRHLHGTIYLRRQR